MHVLQIKRIALLVLASISMAGYSSLAHAAPITLQIDVASSWSLVHPVPNTGSTEWLWFDEGQLIELDLTDGVLTLGTDGPQAFSLSDTNGNVSALDITGLSMDLNDTDGFLGGTLDYVLDGVAGTFTFTNTNYDGTMFNSSTFNSGGPLEVYLWGGDSANGLGIDLGMTPVPVPAAVWLLLSGLGLLGVSSRR